MAPADVYLSRFEEPRVAVLGRRDVSGKAAADELRALLRAVLPADGDRPPPVAAVLAGAGADVAGIVELLQQAQAAADRPVTALPADTAPSQHPPSGGLHRARHGRAGVGPPAPGRSSLGRRRARSAVAATGCGRPGRPAPAAHADDDGRACPSTTVGPPAALLYRADFSGPEWATPGGDRQAGVVDGEYRTSGRGTWGSMLWRALGQRRISVSVVARANASQIRLTIQCGVPVPGNKFLNGSVQPDGSLGDQRQRSHPCIRLGARPSPGTATGVRPTAGLHNGHVAHRRPFLNDAMLGVGEGTRSFALDGVILNATSTGDGPFDLSVQEVTITGR